MRLSVTTPLLLALGFVHSVGVSFSAHSGEGERSGHDVQSFDTGLGDWSEQGDNEITNMKGESNSKDQTADVIWPAIDFKSEFVVEGNSKSFFQNQQIIEGIIAGGVTGVILAAILSALLMYNWLKKNNGGYILGWKIHREEVVV